MVRMDDEDTDANDLIDRVILNENLATSSSFSSVRTQLGFYGKATLLLSFRVRCSENFYRSDCSHFCEPQSSDTEGHFTCNSMGNRVCSTGYTGSDCRMRKFLVYGVSKCIYLFHYFFHPTSQSSHS